MWIEFFDGKLSYLALSPTPKMFFKVCTCVLWIIWRFRVLFSCKALIVSFLGFRSCFAKCVLDGFRRSHLAGYKNRWISHWFIKPIAVQNMLRFIMPHADLWFLIFVLPLLLLFSVKCRWVLEQNCLRIYRKLQLNYYQVCSYNAFKQ